MKIRFAAALLAGIALASVAPTVTSAQAVVSGIAIANPSAVVQASAAFTVAQQQRPVTYKPQIDQANVRKGQIEAQLRPLITKLETDAKAAAPNRAALQQQLAALLNYGEPYAGPSDGLLIVVTPRFGTVSPWASKATDIAHNCGLAVHRVERVVEYRIGLKSGLLGKATLTEAQLAQVAALLHDRMTESVMFDLATAHHLFDSLPAAPMAHVDVLGGGKPALLAANSE